jgi:hypothetical protein
MSNSPGGLRVRGWVKKQEGRNFWGCGLLENVADLVVQLGRRTWRAPSSSRR